MTNVDNRRDRKPPHSHFVGAPMPYFIEFSPGYGMHQGYLPGDPHHTDALGCPIGKRDSSITPHTSEHWW